MNPRAPRRRTDAAPAPVVASERPSPRRLLADLTALATELRATDQLERGLGVAARGVARVTASAQATIRLLDASGERLLVSARHGPPMHGRGAGRFGAREGFLGWALAHDQAAFTNRPATDVRFARRKGQLWMPTALLAVPLHDRRGMIGTLAAARDDGRPFRRRDLEVARLAAEIVALHVEAGRQERLSRTDDLTLLGNPRHLRLALPEAVKAAHAAKRPMSLIAIDLDHFGTVNNTLGFEAANDVLREVAARIREGCRSTDRAFRAGGDEFIVSLPGVRKAAATRIGERILRSIAGTDIPTKRGPVRITASLGVATLGAREDVEGLRDRADDAAHVAKRRGRNRVVAAAPLPAGAGRRATRRAVGAAT